MEELYLPSDGGELSFVESNGNIMLEQGSQNVISVAQPQSNVIYMPATQVCYMQQPVSGNSEVISNNTQTLVPTAPQAGQQIFILQASPSHGNVIVDSQPQANNIVFSNSPNVQPIQQFTVANPYTMTGGGQALQVVQNTPHIVTSRMAALPQQTVQSPSKTSQAVIHTAATSPVNLIKMVSPIRKSPVTYPIVQSVNNARALVKPNIQKISAHVETTTPGKPIVSCPSCKNLCEQGPRCLSCGVAFISNVQCTTFSSATTCTSVVHTQTATTPTPPTAKPVLKRSPAKTVKQTKTQVLCPYCKKMSHSQAKCDHCGNTFVIAKQSNKPNMAIPSLTSQKISTANNQPQNAKAFMVFCTNCKAVSQPGSSCTHCHQPFGKNFKFVVKPSQENSNPHLSNNSKKVFTVSHPTSSIICKKCGQLGKSTIPCIKCFPNSTVKNSPVVSEPSISITTCSMQNPTSNQITAPQTLKTQKVVVCKNCGIISDDFNVCTNCRRKIDKDAKVMSIVPPPEKNPATSIDRKPKPKGRAKAKTKIQEEPECLTISSDEEEENNSSIGNKEDNDSPLIASFQLLNKKEPIITNVDLTEPLRPLDFFENPCGTVCRLPCKQVRIGSYQTSPKDRIMVFALGFRMEISSCGNGPDFNLDIAQTSLMKILASFHSNFPCLFLYVKPSSALAIRQKLKMSDATRPYFDPAHTDQSFRRIVLFPDKITTEAVQFMRQLYSDLKARNGTPFYEDILESDANHILVRSFPKGNSYPPKGIPASLTLLTYPPKPNRGAISITTDDYMCLEEEQFLNDVIIDFYLKWLMNSKLSAEDRSRTHVFSTFFYKRLTAKPKKGRRTDPHELDPNLTASQKRHARVKSWTKNINIFQKDFIIIPINEHSHWFLAIICFPGLETDKSPPVVKEPKRKRKKVIKFEMPMINGEMSDRDEASSDDDELLNEEVSDTNEDTTVNENATFKNPCILIFDSLTGPRRSRIVATLREYLTDEYLRQTGVSKIFTKDNIKGATPHVPQQQNYSDCGIFTLQFAESFFEAPLKNFCVPIKTLRNWFPQSIISKKRQEIADLIKRLMIELRPDHKITLPQLRFTEKIDPPKDEPSTDNTKIDEANNSDHILRDPETSEVLLIVNRQNPMPSTNVTTNGNSLKNDKVQYRVISTTAGGFNPQLRDPRCFEIPKVSTIEVPQSSTELQNIVLGNSTKKVSLPLKETTVAKPVTTPVSNQSVKVVSAVTTDTLASQLKYLNSLSGNNTKVSTFISTSNGTITHLPGGVVPGSSVQKIIPAFRNIQPVNSDLVKPISKVPTSDAVKSLSNTLTSHVVKTLSGSVKPISNTPISGAVKPMSSSPASSVKIIGELSTPVVKSANNLPISTVKPTSNSLTSTVKHVNNAPTSAVKPISNPVTYAVKTISNTFTSTVKPIGNQPTFVKPVCRIPDSTVSNTPGSLPTTVSLAVTNAQMQATVPSIDHSKMLTESIEESTPVNVKDEILASDGSRPSSKSEKIAKNSLVNKSDAKSSFSPNVFKFNGKATSSGRKVATPKRYLDEEDTMPSKKRISKGRNQLS